MGQDQQSVRPVPGPAANDDCGLACVCVKDAAVCLDHGAGINGIAKTRNVCVWYVVGWRPSGSENIASAPNTVGGIVNRSGSDEGDVASNSTAPQRRPHLRSGPRRPQQTARGHAAKASEKFFAIGQVVTIRFAVAVGRELDTAARTAVWRCGECMIVSASGCGATPTQGASNGSWNINEHVVNKIFHPISWRSGEGASMAIGLSSVLSYSDSRMLRLAWRTLQEA